MARLRDGLFAYIALGGWQSLVTLALRDVRDALAEAGADQAPEDVAASLPVGWKQNVLVDWAPYLFPGLANPAELGEIVDAVRVSDPDWLDGGVVPLAVQTRFRSPGKLQSLIQEVLG
jgi:hypothetical protein